MLKLTIWVTILVFGLSAGILLYYFVIFDPFQWGLVQSERFTWQVFETVRAGDRIDSVIERLGQPVRPPEEIAVLTQDPSDSCFAGGCKKYVFAGAVWGATFKEAIVIAGPKGDVVYAVARQE